jgi:hypothetical protein
MILEVARESHATLSPTHLLLGLKSVYVCETNSWEKKAGCEVENKDKLGPVRSTRIHEDKQQPETSFNCL